MRGVRLTAAIGLLACVAPRARGDCQIFEMWPAPGAMPDAAVGSLYDETITVIMMDGYIEFTVSSGTLPAGLSLVGPYGAYVTDIQGTPTASGVSSFCITAACWSRTDSRTQCYTISVAPPCAPPLSISPSTLPDGAPGVPYSVTLTATGGSAPYTFALTAGRLPWGLTLSSSGTISGIPTQGGTYAFDVLVRDASGCATQVSLQIHICVVSFAPTQLPNAVLQTPYSCTLSAVNGVPPLRYGVASGALPPGIRLASWGVLSGSPTAFGTYYAVIEATDATGCTGRGGGSLRVQETRPDFVGTPRIVRVGDAVSFTDLSSGNVVSRDWRFGDGGRSTLADPTHAYTAPGRFTVTLDATGASETWTEKKLEYILATTAAPDGFVTGQGPAPTSAPRVLGFDALARQNAVTDIVPYAAPGFGANVGAGNIDGAGVAEILTAPGPSPALGPHVRAFTPASVPISKVSFYAYGTLRYGATAIALDIDADAPQEIVTTPGPAAVFGPHVRGFNYDGTPLAAMPGVSFYAYGTLRYAAHAGGGDIDGAGREEILTAPGPGPAFDAHVRAFAYGPPLAALSKVNFVAFFASAYGATVAAADMDGDGFDELLAGRGPAPSQAPEAYLYDYDGGAVAYLDGSRPFATAGYGVEVQGGDLNGTPKNVLLVAMGPDPAASQIRGLAYDGSLNVLVSLDLVPPYLTNYGVHVAVAAFGL